MPLLGCSSWSPRPPGASILIGRREQGAPRCVVSEQRSHAAVASIRAGVTPSLEVVLPGECASPLAGSVQPLQLRERRDAGQCSSGAPTSLAYIRPA